MGVPGVLAFLGTEHPPWPRFGGSQGILFLGEGFRGRSAERRSHGSGALRGRSGLDDPGLWSWTTLGGPRVRILTPALATPSAAAGPDGGGASLAGHQPCGTSPE